jgi:hypothetical protein
MDRYILSRRLCDVFSRTIIVFGAFLLDVAVGGCMQVAVGGCMQVTVGGFPYIRRIQWAQSLMYAGCIEEKSNIHWLQ